MKIKEILNPFFEETKDFIKYMGNKEYNPSKNFGNNFFIQIDDEYIPVNIDESYWIEEDDGMLVYRINDKTLQTCLEEYKKMIYKKMIELHNCSDDLKKVKLECIQSLPKRFREEAYESLEYANDIKTLNGEWLYFLSNIIDGFTEKEKEEYEMVIKWNMKSY